MKALLRKDLYTTVGSLRMIFLIMAIFAVVTVFAENTGFYVPYLVVLPSTLGSTLINLDTREKWDRFALTLPVSRRTVIGARYVFMLLLVLFGTATGAACFALRTVRGFESGGIIEAVAVCMAAGLTVPSVLLPVAYKFGADKGRYIVIFLIMGLMIGLMSLAGENFDLSGLPLRVPAWTLPLAAAGLFALSWAVSVRIYEKKEIG